MDCNIIYLSLYQQTITDMKTLKTTLGAVSVVSLVILLITMFIMCAPSTLVNGFSEQVKTVITFTCIGSFGLGIIAGFIYSEIEVK